MSQAGILVRLGKVTLWVILLMISQTIAAQSDRYSVQHYTSENGLPQNSVSQISEDKYGFIWFVTQGGVARFDGEHFRVFNSENTHGLIGERSAVLAMGEDSGIVIRPDLHPGYLVRIMDDFSAKVDSSLFTGKMLIGHSHPPFFYMPLLSLQGSMRDSFRKSLLRKLPEARGYFMVDSDRAYVVIDTTLVYVDKRAMSFVVLTNVPPQVNVENAGFHAVFIDSVLLLVSRGKVTAYREGRALADLPVMPQVYNLLCNPGLVVVQNGDPERSIIRIGKEVYLLHAIEGMVFAETLFHQDEVPDITCIFMERSGQAIFVGTQTNGLYLLKKKQFRFVDLPAAFNQTHAVYGEIALNDGKIVNKDFRYDPVTGKISPNSFDIGDILHATDGSFWFGSRSTIVHSDPSFTHFTTLAGIHGAMTAIVQGANGTIWFATEGEYGFYEIPPGQSIKTLAYPIKASTGQRIMVAFDYDSTRLLLGAEKGLYFYDKQTHTIGASPFLPGVTVREIYRARDGGVWVGTYGSGFYQLVGGRLVHLPYDNRKFLRDTHCFFEDNSGRFWITTNNGLFAIKKGFLDQYVAGRTSEVKYSFFDKDDGMSTDEFNGGCTPCLVFSQQTLYLPSLKGTVYFKPDSIRAGINKYRLFIDGIAVDRDTITNFNQVQFAAGFKYASFLLSTPYFDDRNNLYIDYQLEGFDNEWRPLGVDGVISYSTLPHGNYTLLLRKYTGDINDPFLYTRFGFGVDTFFYETKTFRFLLIVAILAILALVIGGMYVRNKQRTHILETKVAERTKELNHTVTTLEETLDELYQSEQYLYQSNSTKEKAISIILHDIKSPLQYAVSYSDEMANSLSGMSVEEIKKFGERMNHSARQMLGLTNELVQWLITDKKSYDLQVSTFDLHDLLVETCHLYSHIASRNGNELVISTVPGIFYITSDKNPLKFIIRNLIDNANKNTRDGKIEIVVDKVAHKEIEISISDTGKQMSSEKIEEVLSKSNAAYDLGSGGLGFAVINDFIALLKGGISIGKNPDQGMAVKIRLPQNIHATQKIKI
jgi:signal transduction histidine kinase/streptogramin lyase